MEDIQSILMAGLNPLSGIRILDLVDIGIVAFCIYELMAFISGTRAMQLIKGLMVLFCALAVSYLLNLYTVYYLLSNGLKYGAVAIVVVFYPELRRMLEYLGRSKVRIPGRFRSENKDAAKNAIIEIGKSVAYFSVNRVGALIIIEKEIALGDIAETGTFVDAKISSPLLETIFYEGSALHDGAVIIRGEKVHAAGCVLPLTGKKDLEQTLGTRHRAGIGITEVSDALALIVSEETGIISMAQEGKLTRFMDRKSVEKELYNIYFGGPDAERNNSFIKALRTMTGRRKNG